MIINVIAVVFLGVMFIMGMVAYIQWMIESFGSLFEKGWGRIKTNARVCVILTVFLIVIALTIVVL